MKNSSEHIFRGSVPVIKSQEMSQRPRQCQRSASLLLSDLIVSPSTSRSKSQHNVIVVKLYLEYDHVFEAPCKFHDGSAENSGVFPSTRTESTAFASK